jgi:hypothetical protein
MSVASLVVSLASLPFILCYGGGALIAIVGAILGHVARRQIRDRGESGAGLALSGVIVGWVSAALCALVGGLMIYFVVHAINTTSYPSDTGGFDAVRW